MGNENFVSSQTLLYVTMLVNGKAFEGTVDYTGTDVLLKVCTGCSDMTCISQFVPSVFPNAQSIYKLFLPLRSHRLCCFLTGTFVLYVAGRLDMYDGLTLILAMTHPAVTPIIRWLFQKHQQLIPTFAIDHEFTFTLTNDDDVHLDLFHYFVSSEDINMPISVLAIDTDKLCGPQSNIDLVHFTWENFIRFSYKRYGMAIAPQGVRSLLPELLFVKHYRVESDGWKDTGNCDVCVEHHKELLLPFHACDLSPECACNICSGQRPSLADCARHILFQYTLHLDRF